MYLTLYSIYNPAAGFKSDLEKDLVSETSGHFRRVLVSLVQGARSDAQVVNQETVDKDVKELRKVWHSNHDIT